MILWKKKGHKTKSTILNLLSPISLPLPLNTHHLQRHKSFYLRSFFILETSPSSVQIYNIWKQERIIFCELRAKLPFYAATTWKENCFYMFTLFLSTKSLYSFYPTFDKLLDILKYLFFNIFSFSYIAQVVFNTKIHLH